MTFLITTEIITIRRISTAIIAELSLIITMACRLFGAKPSSERMLLYCQLDHRENISAIYF